MDLKKEIIRYKNKLNTIAELGWQELKTTKYIFDSLQEKPVKLGFAGKKVGLLYKIGQGKEAILLRADIDALQTKMGVRHICGHSSHTSALMGALLNTREKTRLFNKKNKSIYFLFQPAEETYPSGAAAFIKESKSILGEIKYGFAAHAFPLMPVGTIGLKKGEVLAGGDYLEIEIFGKIVHVKDTPEGIDALEAAAQIILFTKNLQKKLEPWLRINIGVANGGFQANTVADYAILKGDVRIKDSRRQLMIQSIISEKIREIEKKTGVKITLKYFVSCPVLINDRRLTEKISTYIKTHNQFEILTNDSLFSFACEDFAFIAQKIPSVYALVGTGDKKDVHQEDCLISDAGTLKIYEYFTSVIEWWANYV